MSSSSFIIVSSTIATIIIITISSFSCRWEFWGVGGYYFWIYLLVREVSNFIEKATDENNFLLILSLFDAMPALWYYHPLMAYGTHM